MPEKAVGLTKDAGFQFGLRKTFSLSVKDVWNFMFSIEGVKIWLGDIGSKVLEKDVEYKTQDGIEGTVKVYKPYSHIRMSWNKNGWKNDSTLQVRVIETGNKATVSFHQEKLLNSAQREEMRKYWNGVMEKLSLKITK